LIRLAVRCRPEQAERVLAELLEIAPGGVEEDHGPDYVEFAVYGPPGEVPTIPELRAAGGDGFVEVSSQEIPDDWADRWRDFHEPTVVGERIRVRPSWESPVGDGLIDVVVDPGAAFGTGAHATTRLCLELLLGATAESGASGELADLGTGSGVLAICAAKLGWAPVRGYDHEPAALEAAAANAEANGVQVQLERVNLREELPPLPPAVIANLTAPLLTEVARRIAAAGRPPKALVCSGLLVAEADGVEAEFAGTGLRAQRRERSGDWAAISFAAA
jgi:ribosomal protein L11 methyltransferase